MRSLLIVVGIAGLILCTGIQANAGNTGKIVGRVVDKEKSEGLPGVNVIVVGTNPIRGAVTDPDGKYTIIGVPIGSYTVRAQMVGYQQTDYNDIKISADATTQLNFSLSSKDVQLGPVIITANQTLVNSMTTASTQTTGAKQIESIPNVKSVEDVVKLQAGVVKQGNQIFLRGGRANEVQYIVDGVSTNNVMGNSGLVATDAINKQIQNQYSGISQGLVGGGSGLSVSAGAIQTISVQTSGFDADQGNAQSGIINIVTKSGGDKYSASASYKTDRAATDNQNETYSSFSLGGPEPLSKYVLPGLGIKIPGSLSFFINADGDRNDGYAQFVHNDFYNPLQRKLQFNGFLGGLMNGLGFNFRDNQNNSFTFSSKINYNISSGDQVFYRYSASLNSNHSFDMDYKYRADSSLLRAGQSLQHVVQWQHFFGQNSFFRLYLSMLENHNGNDVAGLSPLDYSSAYKDLDVNNDGFLDIGTSQQWYSALTRIWSMKFGYEGQVHPLHLLKAGFEFSYEEIQSTEIDYPTRPHSGVTLPDTNSRYSRGLYPGYGWYRWNIDNYPNHGALYLQDNIEFSGLNIHIGLRYDYFDIGRQVYYQDWIDAWKTAFYKGLSPEQISQINPDWVENLGYEAQTDSLGNTFNTPKGLKDRDRFLYYLTHGSFSPRLSIGYPVTDRIVFYFNYGHFLQFPDRDQYFKDPFIDQGGATLGNPNLKTQRTVSYEAGFADQFNEDMAFSVHAFYKDIFDYATAITHGDVYFMENLDFASARGFEVTYNQSLSGNFSTSVSYSYQIAKGRSSNPLQNVYEAEFQLPRETRLNWDQNHTVNVFTTYKVGPQEEGKLFGLNNYGISLTWSFGSGFPYNGYAPHQTVQYGLYAANSETAPYTSTFNLSMYKGLRLMQSLNVMLTLDVLNLFDRRNPLSGSILSYTGRVKQYGDVYSGFDPKYPETAIAYSWNQAEHDILTPYRFEAPRQFLLGIKLNWE